LGFGGWGRNAHWQKISTLKGVGSGMLFLKTDLESMKPLEEGEKERFLDEVRRIPYRRKSIRGREAPSSRSALGEKVSKKMTQEKKGEA